jgi:membrane-associated phospholipid phosphatase
MRWTCPLVALTLCVSSTNASAEPHELRNTGPGFLALETGGVLLTFAAYSLATGDTPTHCSWCEPNSFDSSVRDALMMGNSRPPAFASHVLSLGVIPLGGFAGLLFPALSEGKGSWAATDAWIMANAFLLTTALSNGTKKLSKRQRPAFYHGRQKETEAEHWPDEEYLSFFSGDTAWAFVFASSSTTLAYLHGYETAPYIAMGGGTLALTTGILRIAGDMHWATDVIAGAAVGTGVGIALPLLLHPRVTASSNPTVTATPLTGDGLSGIMLSGTF